MKQIERPLPVGAIWIRGHRLKKSLINYFSSVTITCPQCRFNFTNSFQDVNFTTVGAAHTLAVKINVRKEKYIAIENKVKSQHTQPDYFIHVYQTDTGTSPVYPFQVNTTNRTVSSSQIEENRERSFVDGYQVKGDCESSEGPIKDVTTRSTSDLQQSGDVSVGAAS